VSKHRNDRKRRVIAMIGSLVIAEFGYLVIIGLDPIILCAREEIPASSAGMTMPLLFKLIFNTINTNAKQFALIMAA